MEYDKEKIDEMTLALLYLSLDDAGYAWKTHDWDATNRLHEKGFMQDPKGKNKSVRLTEEGMAKSKELFVKYFMTNFENL
jgi:Domain of unknown function (DUF6429)